MGHCFSHLSLSDRYKIEAALLAGEKPQAIADRIHVHVSTIYREKNRARMTQLTTDLIEVDRYNPDEAHRKYRENLKAKGAPLKIGKDHALAEYLETKVIEDGYSPAAALAAINLEGRGIFNDYLCRNFLQLHNKGCVPKFNKCGFAGKVKAQKAIPQSKDRKTRPGGRQYRKTPPEVEARETVGDWEMDTVYSSKAGEKDSLLVLTERKSRLPIMELMPDRTMDSVAAALARIERRFGSRRFRLLFRTITVDNGGEFSDVERLEQSVLTKGLRTKIYYCHPYSSYERGSNENENRMIRRHFPKGTDFGKVTAAEVKRVESWIANYPRKILDWKTSAIVFKRHLDTLN